ncbi:Outer membrane usher protein FimD/PapC [Collimonas sp. OK307]|uniref:fimbria/pilus outer membrane usher protein n=1 Tax=Collimonas sp. OK307 TaxID=1801620 RepID=UPI0008F34FF5|nr:fimbria/pilus outer membrane usher protein [Collimonas sp. OK307]SFH75030.1 Outer membrane usher protein FimD/PapC [Collimonas sp. OK307]
MKHSWSSFGAGLHTLALAAATLCASSAFAENTSPLELALAEFDADTLKRRGLDPALAGYFAKAPRYLQGRRAVSLIINGEARGRVQARFDADGALMMDKDFLKQARLVLPHQRQERLTESEALSDSAGAPDAECSFLCTFPATIVTLRPNLDEIELVVPTAALASAAPSAQNSHYERGGTAGMFNYDVLSQHSQYGSYKDHYVFANTELGLNVSDWIIRSRQSYSAQNNRSDFQQLYTYAQHTFVDMGTTMQIGQIDMNMSMFGGAAITGVQFGPEAGLSGNGGPSARINGLAQSQARVEVRQNGALLYTTVVPPGPFSFEDVPLLSSSRDVDVHIIEENGATQHLTIPAASLEIGSQGGAPGYSFAVGKVRTFGSGDSELGAPVVAAGSAAWKSGLASTTSVGLLASKDFVSGGVGLDNNWVSHGMSTQLQGSHARREGVRGAQARVAWRGQLYDAGLSTSVSVSQRTAGYRELGDTFDTFAMQQDDYLQRYESRYRTQLSGSVSWRHDKIGGLNLSYTGSSFFNGRNSQQMSASWSKSIGNANVSLNLQRDMTADTHRGNINKPRNQVYLSVSMPLGNPRHQRRVYTSVSGAEGRQRATVGYSERINEYASYNLSTNYDTRTKDNDISANLALLPRYARTNLMYSRSSTGSNNTSIQVQGGIAAHANGLTASPYPIQDTFGIVKVGDVGGVKIDSPAGPVWTDFVGQAVLPQLLAYNKSRVVLTTKGLPRNIDIVNGIKEVNSSRGAVAQIDFEVIKTRRMLLNITTLDKALPKGASVLDADGNFLTIVLGKQKIFLNNVPAALPLMVETDKGSCLLDFKVPAKANTTTYFETLDATCR